ncbi:hypothetical protein E4U21_005787 [Claviceps maximensis]|nr:hypothetical protein E4U21_005787 [Claviceps maximensis]
MTNSPAALSSLDKIYSDILTRRKSHNRFRKLTLRDPSAVDFSSNGYLSLSTHPVIKEQYLARLAQASSSSSSSSPQHAFSLGSCGSRLLDGNSPLAEDLEREIATFHGAPAALLFNSGFEANTGLFSCAPQRGDVVVYDELIHASVHDGIRLSRAEGVAFAHNCVKRTDGLNGRPRESTNAGLPSLEEILKELGRRDQETDACGEANDESARSRDGHKTTTNEKRRRRSNIFIAVEAVYSMDGDVAPLQTLVDCVEACLPDGNGYIIVDEAHSTGWMGERGRGLVSSLGLEKRIWARVHTFGKAMGCAGAAVLCSPTTRSYLINYARSLIFTTAMGFPVLAAIQTAYHYLSTGQASVLSAHLLSLMSHTHRLLVAVSRRHSPPSSLFRVPAQPPQSPILPLFSSRARSLAGHCQERGYTVRAIVAPTVPLGSDRVRLCLHAANTVAEVRGLCLAIEEWLRGQLGGAESPDEAGRVVGEARDIISASSKL